jgi:hypothetical protein
MQVSVARLNVSQTDSQSITLYVDYVQKYNFSFSLKVRGSCMVCRGSDSWFHTNANAEGSGVLFCVGLQDGIRFITPVRNCTGRMGRASCCAS